VHDSGKFSIPAEILAKPTAPKPEEFELLRTYVMATSSVLAPIHVLSPVAGGRNRAAAHNACIVINNDHGCRRHHALPPVVGGIQPVLQAAQ
jgi:hypothetical protein